MGFTKKQFIRGGVGDLAKERGLIPPMSKVGGGGLLRNGGSYSEEGLIPHYELWVSIISTS